MNRSKTGAESEDNSTILDQDLVEARRKRDDPLLRKIL